MSRIGLVVLSSVAKAEACVLRMKSSSSRLGAGQGLARRSATRHYSCSIQLRNATMMEKDREMLQLLSKQDTTPGEDETVDEFLSDEEVALLEALRHHEQILAESSSAEGSLYESLCTLRDCYTTSEYWDCALAIEEQLEQLERSQRGGGNVEDLAAGLHRQGKLVLELGNLHRADVIFRKALTLYQKNGQVQEDDDGSAKPDHNPFLGQLFISMAAVPFRRQEFADAIELVKRAEKYFRSDDELVNCWQRIAYAHRVQQKFSEALRIYTQCLDLLETMPMVEPELVTGAMLDVADMHAALDQHDEAEPLYTEILKAAEESDVEDKGIQAIMLNNLGKIDAERKLYALAIEKLQRAVELHREAAEGEWTEALAGSLNNLGSVQAQTGDTGGALLSFKEALLMFRSIRGVEDPQVVHLMRNITILRGKDVAKWGEGKPKSAA